MTFVFVLAISVVHWTHTFWPFFSNCQTSALVREQRDLIGDDDEAVNLNTPPADVIKFISNRITDIGAVLKDDQIVKVIKRLKKMVRSDCSCYMIMMSFFFSIFSSVG